MLKPTRSDAEADHYEITQTRGRAEIIPGLQTEIWGYNGTFPGPTVEATRGRRTVVTHTNRLPVPTVVHLHGGHTPPQSDGYPTDYLTSDESLAAAASPAPAMSMAPGSGMPGMAMPPDKEARVEHGSRSYDYPNDQRAATLWYHDHRMDFTGPSVYRGLAGFHLVRDEEEAALPLPKGPREIPLMICDRAFNADGSFQYPSLDPTLHQHPGVQDQAMQGVLGDVMLVNGAAWPQLEVDTARYRFRILNACNARVMRLALQGPGGARPIVQIGSDGGLLAAPISHRELVVAPAQRFDVVVDFSGYRVGDEITLLNLAGAGSAGSVMRFKVTRTVTDTASVPDRLAAVEPLDPAAAMTRRTMDFHRYDAGWFINGHPFDPAVSEADVRRGSTELWTLVSDYHHPVHIHLIQFQVVSRDGGKPGPYDAGWKDTVFVNGGEKVEVIAKFDGEPGRYMLHCHNLEHEDMTMMANFRVV
ncbi:multicopper oxidase family protein [Streptomyces tateyamensis]|uniref:multicopper oxidase family protein n=1 Tax=Streptomyces tateyamensis TaxID=565073 RepID=UPI003CCC80A6